MIDAPNLRLSVELIFATRLIAIVAQIFCIRRIRRRHGSNRRESAGGACTGKLLHTTTLPMLFICVSTIPILDTSTTSFEKQLMQRGCTVSYNDKNAEEASAQGQCFVYLRNPHVRDRTRCKVTSAHPHIHLCQVTSAHPHIRQSLTCEYTHKGT